MRFKKTRKDWATSSFHRQCSVNQSSSRMDIIAKRRVITAINHSKWGNWREVFSNYAGWWTKTCPSATTYAHVQYGTMFRCALDKTKKNSQESTCSYRLFKETMRPWGTMVHFNRSATSNMKSYICLTDTGLCIGKIHSTLTVHIIKPNFIIGSTLNSTSTPRFNAVDFWSQAHFQMSLIQAYDLNSILLI